MTDSDDNKAKPMPDHADTPKILDELSKNNAAKPKSRVDFKKQAARRRIVILLALLLLMISGIAYLGYQQWSLTRSIGELASNNQQLSQTVNEQRERLEELRVQLSASADTALTQLPESITNAVQQPQLESFQESINSEIAALNQVVASLESRETTVTSTATPHYEIIEAGFLLRTANRTLTLGQDAPGALALLEMADQVLETAVAPGALALRQSIGEEILQLKSIPTFDSAGVYLTLGNLINQVDLLQLSESMRDQFLSRTGDRSEGVNSEDSPVVDSGVVNTSLEFLSDIFVFKNVAGQSIASLSPKQESQLKQNVKLLLEQGQLALLMRDQNQFLGAVQNAKDIVQRYMQTQSGVGQTTDTELARLLTVNINPALPDLSESLALIKQLSAEN